MPSEGLSRVWHGEGEEEELDVYAHQRRRVALDNVQSQAGSYARMTTESDPAEGQRPKDK